MLAIDITLRSFLQEMYFGSALFTDNLTISAPLKFNMHVLITCHPIQITCARLVPWCIHNAAQEPDTQ